MGDDGMKRVPVFSIATFGAIGLYLVFALVYLRYGRLNADEGWYLYASNLVIRGKIPYQDFSFTQMPLLPYVYGVPQALLGPSLLVGRATSVFFSFLTLVMSVLTARRLAGESGGAVVAILLTAFTGGIYFDAIVKTYSLVVFFFASTLYVLIHRIPDSVKYPLAVTCALLSTMVRLSAIAFALPIILFGLTVPSQSRSRFITIPIIICLVFFILGALFLVPDGEAALFNLIGTHIGQWGDASTTAKIKIVLLDRIPSVARDYPFPVLLALFSAYLSMRIKGVTTFLKKNPAILAVGAGGALFVTAHFVTGGWYGSYLTPAAILFLTITGVVFASIYNRAEGDSRLYLEGVLLGILFLLPVAEGVSTIDISRGKTDEVAAFVRQHTEPSDSIMVLEALWIAVEADRAALPGMTMAQFSYQDLPTSKCIEYKVVNSDMILGWLKSREARVVILTDGDMSMLARKGVYSKEPLPADTFESLQQAIGEEYELCLTIPGFGQRGDNVYVWLRRDNPN